jgi:hypothetical protein
MSVAIAKKYSITTSANDAALMNARKKGQQF